VAQSEQISVVIPCFNHGRFLGDAVGSALAQEGPPQVIVVDDGSTERETLEALEQLPSGVRLLRQENSGVSVARNAGAAASSGAMLLMLDADDRLAGGALAALRDALGRDSEAAYSYGVMRMFGAWSGEVRFPGFDPYALLYRPLVGSPGAMLVRREAFDSVGGYDPTAPGYEDWDFQLSVLERGWGAVRVDRVTLEYRKHSRSALSVDRGRHRELMRFLRRKHAGLYDRADQLAGESRLGPIGRLVYRTWWAWRPVPAGVERVLYRLAFR